MSDGLYDTDALAWSEQQADLLRRLQRGERVNAEIDWPNLIEEIADVGLSELHGCESLLELAMAHLIKLRLRPAETRPHWTGEVLAFLGRARRYFTPSMRPRIDLDEIYRLAQRQTHPLFREDMDSLPAACPWTLDELLARDPEVALLIARLGGGTARPM